jgi:hypothetical protein
MDAGTAVRASGPSWAAVGAWGAGLLQLALGAGLMTGTAGGAARGDGAVLVILGAAAIGWGAATLARGRIMAPRAAIAAAIGGMLAVVVALALDPSRTSIVAVGAASALLIAVALGCAGTLRRADARPAQPPLAALFVAAVVVAAVVTPALGATEAGRLAPDHGEHRIVDPGHQH